MGLGDVFKKAAVTAGNIFGDVFASVRYEQISSSVYDVSAGVASAISTSVVQKVLFATYDTREIPGSHIQPGDVRGLIVQTGFVFHPKIHDQVHRIEQGVSTIYEVVDVSEDPAHAIWEVQLRKP